VHEGRPKISPSFREGIPLLQRPPTDERAPSLRPISASCAASYACRVNVRYSAPPELEVYEISDLVIDLARQRVTRGADEIALPKLSFEMLLVLMRAAPAVLSNNELMARVWPGLVVSPETVSQRVKLLRDALGDDPRAPRYIAGLRGRGYRLIPEVRSAEEIPPRLSRQSNPVQSDSIETARIDPQFAAELTKLSQMRSFHGEFAEGVLLAERAIAADPANPWSRSRQSAYNRYLELGDLAAARDVVAGSSAAGLAPFQLLQYLGDWRAAGEAVYDVPERLRSAWTDSLAAEAVRDLALHTGDFARAICFIESAQGALSAVPLAHVLLANGQRAESEKLLVDTLTWPHRRVRADALALQGHRDAAVTELAEAFRSGERTHWWYTIERDPVWDSMRSDPRFQAIAAEARAHAAAQRGLLEEMRRKGEVPYRSRGRVSRRQT
jgi:DNA-binding winged helix-turn-helix (wHTH) protein